MISLIMLAGMCFAVSVGFTMGKVAERSAWNQLIKEGKLPKPSDRNTYGNVPRR